MNNENYEKDPRWKLSALLIDCGWQKVEGGVWEKGNVRLLVDGVGVFLFRWLRSRWVRTHGLSHTSMWRIVHTREMAFSDGAKLNLEYGVFTPGTTQKRTQR